MSNVRWAAHDADTEIPCLVGSSSARSNPDEGIRPETGACLRGDTQPHGVTGLLRGLTLCLALVLLGSSAASAKKFSILTEPVTDGRVFIDGEFVGVAPVTVEIKVRRKQPAEVTVEKEGAKMEKSEFVTSTQQQRIVVRLVATSRRYQIVTQPVADGRVYIDDEFAGVAPISVVLSLTESEPIVIRAEKRHAINQESRRVSPSASDTDTTIVVQLEENQAFLETKESDVCNKWITVTPRQTPGSSDRTWQKLISLVTDTFPDLQQVDRISYYIRSAWRVREYSFNVLRHRLLIKRSVGDDFSLRLMLDCEIARQSSGNYRDEDFEDFRRIFPIDDETLDFLRDQL